MTSVKSLVRFKEILRYAWGKTQQEATRYWEHRRTDMPESKTRLGEDARLMVVVYAIVQAGCPNILPLLHAAEDFVNINQYDECAPLATVESAIKVIQFEYEEYKQKNLIVSEMSDEETEQVQRIVIDSESKASVGDFALQLE